MRNVAFEEHASSPALLRKVESLFEDVAKNGDTITAVVFPWFPSLAKIRQVIAGTKLYLMFHRIIMERKQTGKSVDDPVQYLIDEGDTTAGILKVSEQTILQLF